MLSILKLGLAVALTLPGPALARCDMSAAFAQPDNDGRTTVPVWSGGNALLFGASLNVNTDGTRRSYSIQDFWGEERAFNNLCNAMSDACAGLTRDQMRDRRLLTQRAAAEGWPRDLLRQTRLSPSIIPMPNGRPCPEVGGYLVSATSLHRRVVADPCDLANYVDALAVPALVLPKRANRDRPTPFQIRGAEVGDLVVASNGDGTRLVYGVVGDSGPSDELGEASIAMNGALLGRTELPENYNHVRGRGDRYRSRGWQVPYAYLLIFSGTRDRDAPYMERERIEAAARRRFEEWGGAARFAACRASYRPR